jgi:hypothetical protein
MSNEMTGKLLALDWHLLQERFDLSARTPSNDSI